MTTARHLKPSVLLHVDDSEDDRILLAHCVRRAAIPFDLRQLGTVAATTAYLKGEGAFADRFAHPFPALILLDCRLDGSKAPELLPPWRAISGCQQLTLVIFTGSDERSDIHRSYQSGADHFLVKPLEILELTWILQTLHGCSFSTPPCYSALQALQHYRHRSAACN